MRLSNTQHHVGIARLLNAARLIEAPAGAATWRRRRRRLISCVCVLDAPLDTATGARWTAHAMLIIMSLLAPVAERETEENEGRGMSRGVVFDCVWALGSPQKTQSMIRCAVRRGCQKSIEAATTESYSLPQQPLPLLPLPILLNFPLYENICQQGEARRAASSKLWEPALPIFSIRWRWTCPENRRKNKEGKRQKQKMKD